MKLRLRSLETNQTIRIILPNTANLSNLKQTISETFPFPSSSSGPPTLFLSLNRKDELCNTTTPNEDTLTSLGLTSGDLVYFSTNPSAFSSCHTVNYNNTLVGESGESSVRSGGNDVLADTQMGKVDDSVEKVGKKGDCGELRGTQMGKVDESCEKSEICGGNDDLKGTQMEKGGGSCESSEICGGNGDLGSTQMGKGGCLGEVSGGSGESSDIVDAEMENSEREGGCDGKDGNLEGFDDGKAGSGAKEEEEEGMEVDEGDEVDDSLVSVKRRFSVPSFLRRVFLKEVGDVANGGDHKMLVISVHAVLLQSGFVGYDPVLGVKVDGFHLSDVWPKSAFGMSLHYTLPEVSSFEVVETVVVKFQALGKFVNVYGSLAKKGFGVHRVSLEEPVILAALSFLFKNKDSVGSSTESDGSMKLYPNKEIFEFWKIVKDGLSYPLLIDLCEKVGFVPPPCFMRLPTELKLKILESLPAAAVAMVACVSTELRYVSSNDDLWKLKYAEEFGIANGSQSECQWKATFVAAWDSRKRRKRVRMPFAWREPSVFGPSFPARRGPPFFGSPFIIGGDYDHLPPFGLGQFPGRRGFIGGPGGHHFRQSGL